jgi:hypothetical protein
VDLGGVEGPDQSGDALELLLEGEVAGGQQVQLGVGLVAQIGPATPRR